MVGDVRILLPAGLALPNANTRVHYMVEYRQKRAIKDAAWVMAKKGRPRPMLKADVTAIIHPDVDTPYFDPHNWGISVKAAIDGIVLAGLLPGDHTRYLRHVTITAGAPVRGWQLELVVTPLAAEPPPDPKSTTPRRPAPRSRRSPPASTA